MDWDTSSNAGEDFHGTYDYYLIVSTSTTSSKLVSTDYNSSLEWYPKLNLDQEVYVGTYNGAPYQNFKGFISLITSGTFVSWDWITFFGDHMNLFADNTDLSTNNAWYACSPKTYYDSGTNECKPCHPSCEYSCSGSEECVHGVYNLMSESSWACPLTGTVTNPNDNKLCTDCLGHAYLEGL